MSVNESLFNALVIHSRNHVPDPSKYYNIDYIYNFNFESETLIGEFDRRLQ